MRAQLLTEYSTDKREREARHERRERRKRELRDGHHRDSESSDDELEDEDDREPLQLEAPPPSSTHGQNLSLPERPRASSHSLRSNEK